MDKSSLTIQNPKVTKEKTDKTLYAYKTSTKQKHHKQKTDLRKLSVFYIIGTCEEFLEVDKKKTYNT